MVGTGRVAACSKYITQNKPKTVLSKLLFTNANFATTYHMSKNRDYPLP